MTFMPKRSRNAPSEAARADAEPASGVTCKDGKLNAPPPAPEHAVHPAGRVSPPPPGAGIPVFSTPLQGDRHGSGEQGGERAYLDTLASSQHSSPQHGQAKDTPKRPAELFRLKQLSSFPPQKRQKLRNFPVGQGDVS